MKKRKEVKKFYLEDDFVVKSLDKDLPISLKDLEHVIDKIHNKYPALDKSEISLIVKTVFENIRFFLASGKVLNINNFLFDTKLHIFARSKDDKLIAALKIKTKTPSQLKV